MTENANRLATHPDPEARGLAGAAAEMVREADAIDGAQPAPLTPPRHQRAETLADFGTALMLRELKRRVDGGNPLLLEAARQERDEARTERDGLRERLCAEERVALSLKRERDAARKERDAACKERDAVRDDLLVKLTKACRERDNAIVERDEARKERGAAGGMMLPETLPEAHAEIERLHRVADARELLHQTAMRQRDAALAKLRTLEGAAICPVCEEVSNADALETMRKLVEEAQLCVTACAAHRGVTEAAERNAKDHRDKAGESADDAEVAATASRADRQQAGRYAQAAKNESPRGGA